MVDTAARLALVARRNEVCRFTITVAGIDMTGVPMAMQVRLDRGVPGAPLIALGTVTTLSAEGLKLDSVTVADGVPTSIIKGRINQSTMQDATKVPYASELGADTVLAYAMQWTLNGDPNTRVEGAFIVRDTAFGSDNAPLNRPVGYGPSSAGGTSAGTLQFGDQIVQVSVNGIDELKAILADVSAAAAAATQTVNDVAAAAATTADASVGQAQAAASDAITAAASVQAASASIQQTAAYLALASTDITYSTIAPSLNPSAAGYGFANVAAPVSGVLKQVQLGLTAAGTGLLEVVRLDTGEIARTFDVTSPGAGVLTLDAAAIGGYVFPDGCALFYRALAGAAIFNDTAAGTIYQFTAADAADGSVTLSTYAPARVALAYTISVASDASGYKTLENRLAPYPCLTLTGGWNAIISYGQSLSNGSYATPALSITQPYYNLTFGSGVRSSKPGNSMGYGNTSPGTTTVIPLVENGTPEAENASIPAGETICTSATSAAVTLAAQRLGAVPAKCIFFASCAGRGGTSIANLSKGSQAYGQLLDQASEMVARAADAGKSAKIVAVPWLQGESDASSGLPRATYLQLFKQLADNCNTDLKAIFGQREDIHLLSYQTAGAAGQPLAQLNAIQLAQMDAIAQHPRIHLVGPIYHLYGDSQDLLHIGPIGQLRFGRYAGRALFQLAGERREPDCIRVRSATASGMTLTIRFDVPTGPLVLDTAFVGAALNSGFKVVDDTGTLTPSAIAVGPDGSSVTMTLNRALGANPRARYALDYAGAGLNVNNGASGNLRDSTPDKFVHGGTTYPLYHVCPAFEQAIVVLEAA